MTARTLRRLVAVAALALGLLVYSNGALHAPLLDPAEAARRAWLVEQMRGDDKARDSARAEAYWARYPDVAASATFGRNGTLGPAGAYEHYRLHGRKEGRVWN